MVIGTFKMTIDSLGDLYRTAVVDVRRGGLEEEKGLFWHRIAQLFHVVSIVSSDPGNMVYEAV